MIELWSKGMIWDKMLGATWLKLIDVQHGKPRVDPLTGQTSKWFGIDATVDMRGGIVVGTQYPTGHRVELEVYFDLPGGLNDSEAQNLQTKLDVYGSRQHQHIEQPPRQSQLSQQYYQSPHSSSQPSAVVPQKQPSRTSYNQQQPNVDSSRQQHQQHFGNSRAPVNQISTFQERPHPQQQRKHADTYQSAPRSSHTP